ncbi:hypothetical protein GEMRC1_008103 [Eukaryota sp. GEM-RC1]
MNFLFERLRFENIFDSVVDGSSEETVSQLQILHPLENSSPVKPMPSLYWKENPIRVDELMSCILKLPSGKASGPSGITFDMLKSVSRQNSLIVEDLCLFFNNVLLSKVVPPKELSASRLVALIKPNKKIRLIAVREAIYRPQGFFSPYQYGIKTIDGASVAALTSDVFFNAVENNCIFNLDFKNAFNSVKRSAICSELEMSFPELGTFFIVFMVTLLTWFLIHLFLILFLVLNKEILLVPSFFCLAIHPILKKLKEEHADLEIVAYMDDISFIAPMSTLRIIANQAADLYDAIALQLNVQKCFLIAKIPVTLIVNSLEVPFVNYLSSSFRFLGCYLGSHDNIVKDLNVYLDSMGKELDQIKELQLEKHVKFFMLKICYSGKVTHLLRSLPPVLTYNFCRSFNKIRTDFLAFFVISGSSCFEQSHLPRSSSWWYWFHFV